MANLKQIEKYLVSKKLPHKVVDLGGDVFTVKGVVEAGIDKDEVVKTLIIRTNQHFVALAVRGKDRVDFKKVRRLFGPSTSLPSINLRTSRVNCELAKADEVLKVCKVPIGAVCPILLDIPVYFDDKVMSLSRINMGSGDLKCGLEMELGDLLKAVGKYYVEDLIKI